MQKVAGLSYRQLNDWDSKGALPAQREAERQWRRFTPRQVFALMVCAELRRQFGAPLDALKFIRTFMLQEKADHLLAAIRLMRMGFAVWLLTDCRSTFIMDHDLEFADFFESGGLRDERREGFMLLQVNPIVKRLVAAMKEPIDVRPKVDLYEQIYASRAQLHITDPNECEVLNLLRDPTNEAVNVAVRDGEVIKATAKKRAIPAAGRELSERDVLRMLREGNFQTLTLKKHDGKLVAVEQSIPIPMKSDRKTKKRPTTAPRKNSDRRGGTRARAT